MNYLSDLSYQILELCSTEQIISDYDVPLMQLKYFGFVAFHGIERF